MAAEPHCWRCNAELASLAGPLARHERCPACGAELHVCRMCRHYDTGKSRQCREPVAEPVQDKTRANFCEWFQARTGKWAASGGAPAGTAAKAALNVLFGDVDAGAGNKAATDVASEPRGTLNDLFKP